jgi:hypothetical protein
MNLSPFFRADLCTAIDYLTPLTAEAPKEVFADYMNAVTSFSALESAYVPVGQTDKQLRDELRILLVAPLVRPLTGIFREALEHHHRTTQVSDPRSPSWLYLEALAKVERRTADVPRLHRRWLLTVAYSVLVAYGRPGAALPTSPAGLTIDVALVPGDVPRTRFVDEDEDDDEGAGVPVTTYTRR